MFKPPEQQPMPTPAEPPPPPNPPMYGSQQQGSNQLRRQTQANSGFGSTFISGATAPAQTGQKSLVGQ